MRLIIYYAFQAAKYHPRHAAKIANCFTCTAITVGMYIHSRTVTTAHGKGVELYNNFFNHLAGC